VKLQRRGGKLIRVGNKLATTDVACCCDNAGTCNDVSPSTTQPNALITSSELLCQDGSNWTGEVPWDSKVNSSWNWYCSQCACVIYETIQGTVSINISCEDDGFWHVAVSTYFDCEVGADDKAVSMDKVFLVSLQELSVDENGYFTGTLTFTVEGNRTECQRTADITMVFNP